MPDMAMMWSPADLLGYDGMTTLDEVHHGSHKPTFMYSVQLHGVRGLPDPPHTPVLNFHRADPPNGVMTNGLNAYILYLQLILPLSKLKQRYTMIYPC